MCGLVCMNTETLGGGDYLFAFRMLMVLFRREFSFCDSLYLWEVRFYICIDDAMLGEDGIKNGIIFDTFGVAATDDVGTGI